MGFGILVLPLRPVALLAAEIQTLQHLSANRILLGVGSGGFPFAPFWKALRVPGSEQGRRTDDALDLLGDLIAGKPVTAFGEDGTSLTLGPPARVPPILIGGNSRVAIRRAAKRGLAWFPSLLTAPALERSMSKLHAAAAEYGQPAPEVTLGGHAMIGDESTLRSAREEFVRGLIDVHHLPEDQARQVPLYGSPDEVVDQLSGFARLGVARVVLALDGGDWMRQCELLGSLQQSVAPTVGLAPEDG